MKSKFILLLRPVTATEASIGNLTTHGAAERFEYKTLCSGR
jgi:hypothetical protein